MEGKVWLSGSKFLELLLLIYEFDYCTLSHEFLIPHWFSFPCPPKIKLSLLYFYMFMHSFTHLFDCLFIFYLL